MQTSSYRPLKTSSYRPALRNICLIALFACLFANTLLAQDSLLSKSDVVKLDFTILAAKKTRIQSKDPSLNMPLLRSMTHYGCLSCGSAIKSIEDSQNDQIVNLL